MQLFYASPALGVRDQSRANPLSFRILRAPFIRVSAHSALRHSTMRAHHLGLARETAAGKHSINIYIYIYIYTRPFVGRKNTNKFPRERWGKERMIVLRNQGDYLERAIHDARFLYSTWTQRERERKRERRGEKDKISM